MTNDFVRPFHVYRWKTVQRGLHLSSRVLSLNVAMLVLYAVWLFICIVLALIYFGLFLAGKNASFQQAFDTFGKYGFFVPMVLLFLSCWCAKLYSRVLWCAIPEPFSAKIFAALAVLGRFLMIYAGVQLWRFHLPLLDLPRRADMILCAVFAWIGLLSELLFFRSLPPSIMVSEDTRLADTNPNPEKSDEVHEGNSFPTKEQKQSVWNLNLNDWFAARFPRSKAVLGWIIPPVLFVAYFCMQTERPAAQSLFIASLFYPFILQVLWIPKQEIAMRVTEAISNQRQTVRV